MEVQRLEIKNAVKVVVIEEGLVYSYPTVDPMKKISTRPKIGDIIEISEDIVQKEIETGNVRNLFPGEESEKDEDQLEKVPKKKKKKKKISSESSLKKKKKSE